MDNLLMNLMANNTPLNLLHLDAIFPRTKANTKYTSGKISL